MGPALHYYEQSSPINLQDALACRDSPQKRLQSGGIDCLEEMRVLRATLRHNGGLAESRHITPQCDEQQQLPRLTWVVISIVDTFAWST
jgi:hypothetical protein